MGDEKDIEISRLKEINKKLVALANQRLIENARLEERALAAEAELEKIKPRW